MDPSFQETLELVLKASNEGVWDWIVGEKEIYYSQRVYDFLGYDEGTAPNFLTEPEKILVRQDVPYLRNVLDLVMMDEEEELLGIDCKVIRQDGRHRWLRIRGVVVREGGRAARIAGSMIDITKRKRAEAALAEESSMLRLVIDHVPVQVYFKDCDSRFVHCNERQAQWLGAANAAEMVGKSDFDYFSEDYALLTRTEEKRIMETGGAMVGTFQKEIWRQKEPTYVQSVKHPWYDSRGKLLGIFGISTDVTKLIAAQTKLEKVALDLQKRNKNYMEELQLAREVQLSLLPELVEVGQESHQFLGGRVEVGQRYLPVMELAGDYFDVLTLSESKLGFFICDVTGRGVRSALIVSMVRGLMEKASKYSSKPERYLAELNRGLMDILGKTGASVEVAASYAVLDLEEGVLEVAGAGLDHPIILMKSGEVMLEQSSSKGDALGSGYAGKYIDCCYELSEIRACLFFTDGIHRAKNADGEAWGLSGLARCFSKYSDESLIAMLDGTLRDGQVWAAGNGFSDDVCLLGVGLR